MVDLSKFTFNNKLLSCVTSRRVTLSVTWTHLSLSLSLYIYICMYVCICMMYINSMPSCCWLLNSQCISVDYWWNLCFFGLETHSVHLEIKIWFIYQVVLLIKTHYLWTLQYLPKKKKSWRYNSKLEVHI